MRSLGPAEIRFWHHLLDPAACWEWRGHRNPSGYGTFSERHGNMRLASRASWEMHKGPIPPGLHVLHRCDNPPCVNPAHLFLGTDLDNAKDRESKGRTSWGAVRYNAILTEAQVIAIRAAGDAGKSTVEIGAMFGISRQLAYNVVSRRRWKRLPEVPTGRKREVR